MRPRQIQALLLGLALAGCGVASASDERRGSGQRPFTVGAVASFSTPWAMSFLPSGDARPTSTALVSEKEGRLWLVDAVSGARQQVGDVPRVRVAGQGGLGDVVAHPGFAANRRVYLTYAEPGAKGTSGAVLGYGILSRGAGAPRLGRFRIIWQQRPKVGGDGHFSHRIAFAKDGSVFLSSGDRQKMQPAQDPASDLGKIIHLTADGQPLGGRFHSLGHRNVLGLAFAPDGRLWASEMGPRGGDEINLVERGRNYGWPLVSNGDHYFGGDIPDHSTRPQFAPPKVWWNPSISPAGMIVYSGSAFPQWRGDLLVGALSGQRLVRVDLTGASARKAEEWPMGARIREVEQGPDGEIYLLEDGGRLLRLDPVRR